MIIDENVGNFSDFTDSANISPIFKDVLFESDEIYDIELQATSYSDLIMRSRNYSSVLDVTQLKPGESY